MFGSSILEVAIGMIFVYLLLSLICSAGNEIIEAALKNRATDLERGIRELFNQEGGGHLVADFYKHPLIHGLFTGAYGRELHKKIEGWDYFKSTNLPAYIPAANFAATVIDLVLHPPSDDKIEREDSPGAQDAKKAKPAQVIFSPPASAAEPMEMTDILAAIELLDNTEVGRALRALAEQANGDVNKLRKNIEDWFNSSMDRVSGWYKRRTKWIILVLGLLLTIFLNVNSITLITALSRDSTLRSLIVAQAEDYNKNAASANAVEDKGAPDERFMRNKQALEQLGLPIGWPNGIDLMRPWENKNFQWWKNLFSPLIGWLLTAAAISMGAPFWFDLLNKVMVIRSTVKPHEKSPEESSEDRQTKK